MRVYVVLACCAMTLAAAQVSKADAVYNLNVFDSSGTIETLPGFDVFAKVSDASMGGESKVRFELHNEGSVGTVTTIYFEEGVLSYIGASIDNGGPGVEYYFGANPHNLPGGKVLSSPFVTGSPNEGFAIGPDPSPMKNGLSSGEWVAVTFDLKDGKTFADVISSLDNSSMRIGAHIQGISLPGCADSLPAITIVPEPATLAILGLGLILVRRVKI
jgi:hypothetical protein